MKICFQGTNQEIIYLLFLLTKGIQLPNQSLPSCRNIILQE